MIERGIYINLSREEIEAALRQKGYVPTLDCDQPGFVYKPHSHPETNIIVVLEGSMFVKVNDQQANIGPGDQVTFPGGATHSSQIGSNGCTYFWVQLPV